MPNLRRSIPSMSALATFEAAARLSALGSLIVLEGEDNLAHHASGRSAALYEPRYGAPAVVELSLASEAHFRAADHVLSPRGLMIVARADQQDEFDAEVRDMQMDRCSVAEAQAVVPILNADVVALAAMADHAWDIDTDLLLQGFAREAKARGATIVTGARVSAIRRDGGLWHVTTAAGDFSGRMLVNAAGPWVDKVLAGVVGRNDAKNVRLVQGSHIIVKKKFNDARAYFFQNTDGRIIFAIPYENEFTLIGTTDRDYLGDPEATAAAFDADGFFITGDQATLLDNAFLKFADRKKDMDQDRQRERLLPGGRKRPGRPRRRDAVRRVRAAQRALGRGRDGHRHRQARNHGDRGRTDRVLPAPDGVFHGAALPRLHRCPAQDADREDPEAGRARGGGRRAGR